MNDLLKKLADPEALKFIVPVLLGFLSAIIGFISAFTMSLISPFIANRTESKKLRTAKSFAMLEDIASRIQKVESLHIYFEEFWKSNYGHHDDFDENIQNFDSRHALFAQEYKTIREIWNNITEIQEKLLGAWLYICPKALSSIEKYLMICRFSYHEDGIGFIDEFHKSFFRNLLESGRPESRRKLFSIAKNQLIKCAP
ncbi:hypothetical protein EON80_15740 [bacterium]|nr:MAG: hypothetical protein EON80_15740 [bacterium]